MSIVEQQLNEREKTEQRLSSYQKKKGAVLFGVSNVNFRAGTPIAFRVVDHFDKKIVRKEVEVENPETGEIEISIELVEEDVPVFRWDFGTISELVPTQNGMNYKVEDVNGDEHSVLRKDVITMEMYEAINYSVTPVLMYNERDELVMVTLYSWDSLYFPCPFLKPAQSLFHRDFKNFMEESEDKFTITGENEDEIIFNLEVFGTEVQCGPVPCTLLTNSDCRNCVSHLVNFAENWDAGRNIVLTKCGRGTMYDDGKFIIRKDTKRRLFIRWIEIDRWVKGKPLEYLEQISEAVQNFYEQTGYGMPVHQVENIREWTKDKIQKREDEIKEGGDDAELKEFRKLKRLLNKKLKELPILTDEQLAVETEVVEEEEVSEE